MRILYVAQNILVPGTNGGSTHVTEVTRALRKGHEVMVMARRGSTGEGVVGVGVGSPPGIIRQAVAPLLFPVAYPYARRFRPQVIYERYSSFGLGVLLGRAMHVPVVSMILDRSATRLTLAGADALVATAPEIVPARYRDKVIEVSWGANISMFRPDVDGRDLRAQIGFSADDIVVGYTGAFYPWHGLDTLVESAILLDRDPRAAHVRYLLVGDGECRRRVEAAIAASGVRQRFVLVGKVPYEEVPRYIAASDVGMAPYNPAAHPQFREGFHFDPLKVFEYMAAARATVTVDSPNMRKMFTDRQEALLVKAGDADALARATLDLVVDPNLRARLAEQGRRLVVDRYSWQAHGRQLGEVFSAVVSAARPPDRTLVQHRRGEG